LQNLQCGFPQRLPRPLCPVHDPLTVSYDFHEECCRDHTAACSSWAPATWDPDDFRMSLAPTDRPIEACSGPQRTRRDSVFSNRREVHTPTHMPCCETRRLSSEVRKVKTLKSIKSREQRVQARRIRHPTEDSSSESEQEALIGKISL